MGLNTGQPPRRYIAENPLPFVANKGRPLSPR